MAALAADYGLRWGSGSRFEPAYDNAAGCNERVDVAALNDDWLSRLGGCWWAPPATSTGTWRSIDVAAVASTRSKIDIFVDGCDDWVVKDPRISLLLPLWDRLALRHLPVVMCVRSPMGVADSLYLRDGISVRRGLGLWYFYNHELSKCLAGRDFLVLDYDSVVDSPRDSVDSCAQFLQKLGQQPREGWSADTCAALAVRSYRRSGQSSRARSLTSSLLADCESFYSDLLRSELRPDATTPEWVVDTVTELRELRELGAAAGCPPRLRPNELEAFVVSERERVNAERVHATSELADARSAAISLAERLESLTTEVTSARLAVADLEGEVGRLRGDAEVREAEAATARLAVADLEGEVGRLRGEAEVRESGNALAVLALMVEDYRLGRSLSAVESLVAAELMDRRPRARLRLPSWRGGGPAMTSESALEAGQLGRDSALVAASGLFEREWYWRCNPDASGLTADPLVHFMVIGWREGRSPSPHFDTEYYLLENPDVATAGVNPLVHFLTHGWREHRDPSPSFSVAAYLERYPELTQLNICPVTHHLIAAERTTAGVVHNTAIEPGWEHRGE
ncbi:MAG: hypothetical protein R2737_14925 [Candidatus Nanopelagicales bacterium]